MSDDAVAIDDGGKMPCLILQYDPPWDASSVGDHYHTMPLDAIADAQLIFGLASDEEAVEFHILNHVADVEIGKGHSRGLRSATDRRIEKGRMLRDLMQQLGDTLTEEAMTVPVTDEKAMKRHIFKISTEVGEGNLRMAKSAAASPMRRARSSVLDSFLGDASGHSINKRSAGYADLQSILSENSDRIEESRQRVLDMKYGHHLHMVIAQRLHEEKMRKETGK
jgi:hypothetical protein